ncbi:sensor histidine kinase [Parapedobacter lycopersici]|uniref:sensor histidine kinase n=1 Tax=Parapedobacter lycopersici TaxID=1864939 RepID=UPI00214DA8F8|nr:ATP-binding protein [Parapedobacter lycopersici]
MTINFYLPARKFIFLAILFFLLASIGQIASAQPASRAQQEFDKLANAYHSNSISADQYLAKADSLTHRLFSEGKHFETRELVDLLELYEDIAWNKVAHSRGRISYYFLFFNNARMFKKRGASMYYAEKITEEYKKAGEEHPLVEQLQKTRIYQELRLYDSVLSVYEPERSYLVSLPERLRSGQVDLSVGLNAMYILSPVLSGYIKMNDTAAVYQTADLSRQIGHALQQKDSITRSQLLYNDLLLIDTDHSIAKFEHRYDSVATILNRMEALKTTYSDQVTNFIDFNLVRLRLENYRDRQQVDSLRRYLEKYKSSPVFGDSQQADVAEFTGQLQAMQGNYRDAYASLTDALNHERDLQMALMSEASDLLYAYTQAEHSEISLRRAEHVKERRTVWLVIISAVASAVVLAIYLLMLRRSRKAKEQVEALNHVANMQVIAMEEAKHQAIRDEQQRLGQDLHDNLSASIAGIKHQLEVLMMSTEELPLKTKLGTLQTSLTYAYDAARNKSHEWFYAAEGQQEQSLETQINLLADSALPDNRYRKHIEIDNGALRQVNIDTRIALLRIIQEAITNIIKHAKATAVDILIYAETDSLVLTIKDDGKGSDSMKLDDSKSKMGLQSIRRRVQYLNGDMTLHSDTTGTEIMVSIPLNLPQ